MVESNQTGGLWPSLYTPFRQLGARVSDWLAPASDASSDDKSYRITVELPGVSDDDIDLQVHEGVLTVTGEKTSKREEEGATWYFSEREYGSFRRSFRLPPDADAGKVEAHVKDGVLHIAVARKSPDASGGRKIAVKKG